MAAEIGLKCYEKASEYVLGIFTNRWRAEETMKFWKWDLIFEKGDYKEGGVAGIEQVARSFWRQQFGA